MEKDINIIFGTDGWRAVIGDQFTFENVKKVARATAHYFSDKKNDLRKVKNNTKICIGYDTRFQSEYCARITAEIFSAFGFRVLLSINALPTPMLSHAVLHHKALGGVMITASHNPYYFNGFKIKLYYGAAAFAEETKKIEELLQGAFVQQKQEPFLKGSITTQSFQDAYLKDCVHSVDLRKIKQLNSTCIIDSMHGSGAHVLDQVLQPSKIKLINIRDNRDPLFGGVHPEPIEHNVELLRQTVRNRKAAIGIAFDGDADRIGLIDERGNFVNSHQIFSLLLMHLVENKKMKGTIIKTISGTYMINRLAALYNCKLIETPVGFKHITAHMLNEDVLIGGEESGGIGFKRHIPERDALLTALYMLDMLACTRTSVHGLVAELQKKCGPSYYDRTDVIFPEVVNKDMYYQAVKKQYKNIIHKRPRAIKEYDGIKFIWEDDSWLLLRMSGTEPVLRIYAESASKTQTQKLLALGKQFNYNL